MHTCPNLWSPYKRCTFCYHLSMLPQLHTTGVAEIPQAVFMLLQWELVKGPDLLDLLNIEHNKKLPEPTAAHYFQQLINAVIFMHNNGFCHRDLKAENCVVDTASQCVKVRWVHSAACIFCIACAPSISQCVKISFVVQHAHAASFAALAATHCFLLLRLHHFEQ